MAIANPYVVAYNGAPSLGAYMALYGNYGAQNAHAKAYRKLLVFGSLAGFKLRIYRNCAAQFGPGESGDRHSLYGLWKF